MQQPQCPLIIIGTHARTHGLNIHKDELSLFEKKKTCTQRKQNPRLLFCRFACKQPAGCGASAAFDHYRGLCFCFLCCCCCCVYFCCFCFCLCFLKRVFAAPAGKLLRGSLVAAPSSAAMLFRRTGGLMTYRVNFSTSAQLRSHTKGDGLSGVTHGAGGRLFGGIARLPLPKTFRFGRSPCTAAAHRASAFELAPGDGGCAGAWD